MIAEERRQRVLDLVSTKGFATLADLALEIQVSESTVRRDLEFWHQQGNLKRTHGGAIFVGDGSSFPALEERIDAQLEEKRAIARAAVGRICDGDTVLLDGGTTTLEAARLLLGRSIQVVTNSLPIAALLAGSRETDLVLLGGYIYPKTGVALGPFTVRMMQDLHVHQTLLSVSGLTERGLFNSNLLLVETERAMMRCADEVVLLADHTKVGRPALAFLCEWSEIDLLVIDRKLEDRKKSMLAQTGARLLIAGDIEEFGR
ncbi:MAG: DeoR/GlpR transcriptional regulator [Planctomycetota bacterium]|nr:MAG: DeoR/GlpR transcriptional regulator [Planctomycetota bacterium]